MKKKKKTATKMFNKKLTVLLYINLFIFAVFSKIMTKDEVLKIEYNYKDKDEEHCPDYSNGDYWYLDRCGIEIYCKGDVCSSAIRNDYNNSTVEFPDSNGNMKSYIADVCVWNSDDIRSIDCNDASECNSDSDCLSNKCEKNHCVRNDDVKIEKCQDTFHYHPLTFSYSVDMTCGKPDGYTCKKNSDCASNICDRDDNTCKFQGRDHSLEGISSVVTYMVIIIIVLIIVIIVNCFSRCFKNKSRSSKGDIAANAV